VFLVNIGVLYLGFLKFLKRNKGKEPDLDLENMGELDVPPPPPDSAMGDTEGIDKLPEFPELPKMPETIKDTFPEFKEKPLPEFKPLQQKPELRLSEPEELPELKSDVDIPEIGQVQKPMIPSKPHPLFSIAKSS